MHPVIGYHWHLETNHQKGSLLVRLQPILPERLDWSNLPSTATRVSAEI